MTTNVPIYERFMDVSPSPIVSRETCENGDPQVDHEEFERNEQSSSSSSKKRPAVSLSSV